MVVKCQKNLKDYEGIPCFTKGKTYEGDNKNLLEHLQVINDNGDIHQLGNWKRHFKIVKQ